MTLITKKAKAYSLRNYFKSTKKSRLKMEWLNRKISL